jgi:hypothetical protein
MTIILDGFYTHGKIELPEAPPGLREGPVRIIVIGEQASKPAPCYLTYGKYQTGKQSTLKDFRDAEWHGEKEWDDKHGE